jgi:hypothetical protein
MSDVQQTTGAHSETIGDRHGYEAAPPPEPTGWAGMVVFGAMMMLMLGTFQAVIGLVAIFDDGYYLVGESGLVVGVDYTAWGWVHLTFGVIALAAGAGLMGGATWARVLGVFVALGCAIMNFAFIAAYPFWSITVIILAVLVIYAITAHGRELQTR